MIMETVVVIIEGIMVIADMVEVIEEIMVTEETMVIGGITVIEETMEIVDMETETTMTVGIMTVAMTDADIELFVPHTVFLVIAHSFVRFDFVDLTGTSFYDNNNNKSFQRIIEYRRNHCISGYTGLNINVDKKRQK